MSNMFLVLVAIVVLGIATAVICLVANYILKEPEQTFADVPLSGTPGLWRLELRNSANGEALHIHFRGHTVLGRGIPGQAGTNGFSVGTENTISARQCEIFEEGQALMIRNLSRVNITQLNGQAVQGSKPLRAGDCVSMGGKAFLLTGMQKVS